MLQILFQIGGERYALDGADVLEILPLVRFREIPGTPDYALGIFQYRGAPAPAIDLCALAGKGRARLRMSTRIIMTPYSARDGAVHPLGLVAEKVTDTRRKSADTMRPSGLSSPGMPWIGGVADDPGGLIQLVRVQDLLTPEVRDLLFAPEAAGS